MPQNLRHESARAARAVNRRSAPACRAPTTRPSAISATFAAATGPIPGIRDAYVCGSVHSGYTSGPYIAKLLAQTILGREPEMPLFPIDRLLTASASPDT
jgi:hypothetical protein